LIIIIAATGASAITAAASLERVDIVLALCSTLHHA
jgi:hypothetical protein